MPFDKTKTASDGVVAISAEDNPDPSFMETVGAAFRQENLIGSTLTNARTDLSLQEISRVQNGYNPYDDIDGYEDHADRFDKSYNPEKTAAIKANIDREKEDDQILSESGLTGGLLSMGAAIADPTILVPGGALVKSGRVGYKVGKSALAVAAGAAVGAGVQEAGLQATQETRTATESGLAIAGSAILGGAMGYGVAKFISKGEWGRLGQALESEIVEDVADPKEISDTIISRMQAVGAANVDEIDLSDLGVGGNKVAQAVARATSAIQLNPGVQTMFSPSKLVRKTYQELVDNTVYTKMEMEGKTLGTSVENNVKQLQRGALAKWSKDAKSLWKQARKDGWSGTKTDFYERVARAARRNDVDELGNEHVSEAARKAREYIFDPTLQQAIEGGLLPDDVRVTTAASYLTRMWNRTRLIGQEDRFKQIARKYFSEQLDKVQFKQDEFRAGRTVVKAVEIDDKMQEVFGRLGNIDSRLAKRQYVRGEKLASLNKKRKERSDLLSSRLPRDVRDAVADARDGDKLIDLMKNVPKAPKSSKKPLLAKLKSMGGVSLNSPLADELKAIGVNPRSAPGLFKKEGGLKAVDNFVASEDDLLRDLPVDQNGYVNQESILDAIAEEMGGNAILSDEALAYMSAEEVLTDWLRGIGLDDGATIKDVRDYLKGVAKTEKGISDADLAIIKLEKELDDFDDVTDSLREQRLTIEGEAKNFSDALEALEREISEVREIVDASPKVKIMVDHALARRAYGKARYEQVKIENQISTLDGVEKTGKLTDELYFKRQKLVSQKTDIDTRVIKAKERVDQLKAMTPDIRKELPEFLDDADRADYVEEIITSVFNNLTGKGVGDVPEWIVPVTRGPLKERTFNIPDALVEDFLENDMETVLRYYTRTMGAEVELARKFGRADMKDQLDAIQKEYTDLRSAAKTAAERKKLDVAEKRDIKNLQAFRDLVRGTYRAAEEGTNWSRITRAALTWNYMRLLGGVTLTSMTDAARLVGVHGLRATMRDALPALVSNVKAARISRADARDLGAVTEAVLQTRLASLAEIQDPYAHGSAYERFLSNSSNVFSKVTGLSYWNDGMKTIASVMTQNRMAKNALNWKAAGKREQAYMAYLGIDEMMSGRIAKQIKAHGAQERGIWGANVSEWDDQVAARTWAAALNKDVDRTIVTKGVADQPLWTRTNAGKLVSQFKSFALASHQRVLIAGLQENPLRLAENMVFASALGMMIGYLKFIERGDFENAQRLLENPGLWVSEGLDRSGLMAVPFEISNTAEKIGIPAGIKTGLQAIADDPDRGGSVSRYAQRNKLGAVLGPSAGLFQDLTTIAEQVSKGDLKKSGAGAIIRQIPGGSLPGVRTGLYGFAKPMINEAME